MNINLESLQTPTPEDITAAIAEIMCKSESRRGSWYEHFAMKPLAENLLAKGFNPIGVEALLLEDDAKYAGGSIGDDGPFEPGIYEIAGLPTTYETEDGRIIPLIPIQRDDADSPQLLHGNVWVFCL